MEMNNNVVKFVGGRLQVGAEYGDLPLEQRAVLGAVVILEQQAAGKDAQQAAKPARGSVQRLLAKLALGGVWSSQRAAFADAVDAQARALGVILPQAQPGKTGKGAGGWRTSSYLATMFSNASIVESVYPKAESAVHAADERARIAAAEQGIVLSAQEARDAHSIRNPLRDDLGLAELYKIAKNWVAESAARRAAQEEAEEAEQKARERERAEQQEAAERAQRHAERVQNDPEGIASELIRSMWELAQADGPAVVGAVRELLALSALPNDWELESIPARDEEETAATPVRAAA